MDGSEQGSDCPENGVALATGDAEIKDALYL